MKYFDKDLVRQILMKAEAFDWSLQGFGMLRLYLSREIRLHVWDSRYRVLGVSDIHTHPWDFESTVIAGQIRDVLFRESKGGLPYKGVMIQCGENACVKESLPIVRLASYAFNYKAGESYSLHKDAIHRSEPEDGTVTIISRVFNKDTEHAKVYFRPGISEFIDAKPCKATPAQIKDICNESLRRYF